MVFSFVLVSCQSEAAEEGNLSPTAEDHSEHDQHVHDHAFACPMHPEVTGHEGEACEKCGMPLEAVSASGTKGHYTMKLASPAVPVESGKTTTLSFKPVNLDEPDALVPLEVQHEKKIHLILVSEDLSWFTHIHPEYQANGSYSVQVEFPFGGTFLAYSEYKPYGQSGQTEQIRLEVSGKPAAKMPSKNPGTSAQAPPYTVVLKPDEDAFYTNKSIHFDGVFSKSGVAYDVNGLGNYLGAKAHMIAVHEETLEFVHLHPAIEGANLQFHTFFKQPGVYRAWLQFMDAGTLRTVDFTLQVKEGSASANASSKLN